MSEKLDGVRAIWTGSEFISRNGNIFPAPQEIKNNMPAGVVLDGELFGGRGEFQTTVGKVRRGDWRGLHYMVFDLVNHAPFEVRQFDLLGIGLPGFCKIVPQIQCHDRTHFYAYEGALLSKGAEGVMLRRPQSKYVHARSNHLLKLKRVRHAEAIVTGYETGNGKHSDKVGAMFAEYQGQTFSLGNGLNDAERANPPAIGSVVTFSYFELTDGGVPRFPVYIGTRDYE